MNIFVTGNIGYIGSFLTQYLKNNNKNFNIIGFDSGFFKKNLTKNIKPEKKIKKLYIEDIRNINSTHLKDVDTIVHLCGLSNDPIGKKFEKVTNDINYKASVKLFNYALKNKVRKFIFASSCSSYGFGGKTAKTENSKINPLTAYAKSKVKFEKYLSKNKNKGIEIIILRFATACGDSPRLRLDLVLNDFVYSAVKENKIIIKSNGKPLRPLIDVEDMCQIINWSIKRKKKSFLLVNAGSNENNYSVKEIAEKVKEVLGNKVKILLNDKLPDDKRSYKVNFNKLNYNFKGFKPRHLKQTILKLKKSVQIIVKSKHKKADLIRLSYLGVLIKNRKLSSQLIWKK